MSLFKTKVWNPDDFQPTVVYEGENERLANAIYDMACLRSDKQISQLWEVEEGEEEPTLIYHHRKESPRSR